MNLLQTKCKVVYLMKDIGEFDSLKTAFKAIYDRITKAVSQGTFTHMCFETIWVTDLDGRNPMGFTDLRDLAADSGWVREGKWVKE